MAGTCILLPEEACFFDEALERSSQSLELRAGANLHHGWQGEFPSWHDHGALWLTDDRKRAESYRSWGLPPGKAAGISTFEVVEDMVLRCADMCGIAYLNRFSSTGCHEEFAAKLHGWAIARGIDAIYEGADQFIFFRSATLLKMTENERFIP